MRICWFRVVLSIVAMLTFVSPCFAAGVTVTSTAGNAIYVDTSNNANPTLLSSYVSFNVTNNTGSPIADAWVTINSFGGTYLSLAQYENGVVQVGPMAAGATVPVFFYLNVSCGSDLQGQCGKSAPAQTFNVNVYSGRPSSSLLVSQPFSETITDSSATGTNTVSSVTMSTTTPTLGGQIVVTVTGDTGTISSSKIFYETPETSTTFPASSFRLIGTSVTLSSGNTGTYANQLLVPLSSTSTTHYVFTQTYLVVGTTTTTTAVSPVAYISSGGQMKHTDTSGYGSLSPIQPASNVLTLSLLASASSFPTGGTPTYTLRVTNSSASSAVLDSLIGTLPTSPASVSYVPGSSTFGGASISDPVISGSTLTWDGPFTISANSYADLKFGATIPNTNGIYTTSAIGYLGSSQIDTTLATGDSAPATNNVSVGATPMLAIASSHTGSFTQGQSGATYSLTVSNDGFGATSGTVTLTDTLPSGMTATAMSGAGWTCTLGTLTCTRSDALSGASSYPPVTLTVNVASNAAASLTNSVTASGGGSTSASGTDVTTVIQLPVLGVTSSHVGNFAQGQSGASYTLTVNNSGSGPTSSAVTLVDTLPSGMTATAMNGTGWSCTLGTLTCTRSDALAASSSFPPVTLTINIASNAASSLTNSVSASGGGASSSATATDVTTVTQLPVLSVSSSHTGNFSQGQSGATYTLIVTNSGPGATSGPLALTDALPAGMTATAMSGTGWVCTVATLTCTRSDALSASASYPAVTLTVNVASNAGSSLTNSVTASGGGALSDSSASDVTTVAQLPVLAVSISHTGDFTQGEAGAIYTLTVSNNGSGTTSGVITLMDTLPTGMTATAMSGTGWSCTLGTLTCTRSDALSSSASYPPVTLTVSVASNAASSLTNSASASGGGTSSSATATDVTTITQLPVLGVTTTHTGSFAQGQSGATYTLVVSNLGAGATSSTITLTDTLPAGMTATAMSGTGWNCTLGTLTCTRSDVLSASASYAAVTLTVSIASNAGVSLTNSVTASGGGAVSSATATDLSAITQLPILSVSSSHIGSFTQGQSGATYTLTVGNTGAGPTAGTVTVTNSLPSGMTATAMSGSGWTCNVVTLTCTRSDALAASSSYPAITLIVSVSSTASGPLTNSVTASGGGATGNVTATDSTNIAQSPVLTVSSSHSGSFVQGQSDAIYTLTVTNSGSTATSGVITLSDVLPTGMTATAIAGTGWSCTLSSLTCTRSDELSAATSYPSVTLSVTVASNAGASLTNAVTASGGGALANASSTDLTLVTQLPILAVVSSHTGNFSQGQTGASYTITVSNTGTGATNGTITVSDTLPQGMTATSIAGTGWSCTLETLTCTRTDSLAAASSYPPVTLIVSIASNAGSSLANGVSVSGGGAATGATASDATTVNAKVASSTTTTLAISPANSVSAGTVETFIATVLDGSTPVYPGVVRFCDATASECTGAALLGSAQLTGSGSAEMKIALGVGNYSIKAVFAHTANDQPSESAPQSLVVSGVGGYPSTTAISATGSAGRYTLTGSVKAFGKPVPTGTVSFVDIASSSSAIGTAQLDPSTLGYTLTTPASTTVSGLPYWLAVGDFNNDGKLDVAIPNGPTSTLNVLIGNGDGTLQPPASFSTAPNAVSYSVAVGDFNADGNLDVVVTNIQGDSTVSVFLGNGDGTFQNQVSYVVGSHPAAIAVADLNSDGDADFVVVNRDDNTVSVLMGNGDGTFQPGITYSVGNAPVSVAIADLNHDGSADLAVSNSADKSVSVLLGNGDGTYQSQAMYLVGSSPMQLAIADANGDGHLDIITANRDDANVSVLLGYGNGTFQAHTTYAAGVTPVAIAVADLNGDSHLDIAVSNSTKDVINILLGNGDGTFKSAMPFAAGTNPYGIAAGDFNGDGLADLAVVGSTASSVVSIFLSEQSVTATAANITLAPGAHSVFASYPGDVDREASQSEALPLSGSPQTATTITLSASSTQFTRGDSLTLTVTVAPVPTGSPLGTISFYNGSTLLGTSNIDSTGRASFTTNSFAAGTYTLTAAYSGNTGFAGSTSSGVSITVQNPPYSVEAPQTPFTPAPDGTIDVNVNVMPIGVSFNSLVTMSASGLPSGYIAKFNPATLKPGSGATTRMTLVPSTQSSNRGWPIPLTSVGFAAGICIFARRPKQRRGLLTLLILFAIALPCTLLSTSCNGGWGGKQPTQQSKTYVVTVTGTSGTLHASTTVTVIIP